MLYTSKSYNYYLINMTTDKGPKTMQLTKAMHLNYKKKNVSKFKMKRIIKENEFELLESRCCIFFIFILILSRHIK